MAIETAVFTLLYLLLKTFDKDYKGLSPGKSEYGMITGYLLFTSIPIWIYRTDPVTDMLLGVVFGCFLTVMFFDQMTKLVSDWIYIPIVICGILLMIRNGTNVWIVANLVLFIVLQFAVFKRTYGLSDTFAFSSLGIVFAGVGLDMIAMLTAMVFAYTYLIVVQSAKKNISRSFRLIEPKAFLPYIGYAFLHTLILL